MDFATLIGLVGAILLISSAVILGVSPDVFINPASLLIVVGGSLLVVLAKFSFAQIARKKGVLGLEGRDVASPFLGQGIQMLVDGHNGDTIKQLLSKERLMTLDQNRSGSKVFTALADVAPAMGMIGTLIGLVQMLSFSEIDTQ